jgi:hypothetical protein
LKQDEKGGEFQVYKGLAKIQYGLAIEDPRSIIRIVNIAPDMDPEKLILEILGKLKRMPKGANAYVLYANYTVADIIDKAAITKPNVIFPTTDPWGNPITMIRNLRVRTVEAILDTEEHVA